jgi:hypothetical protein
MKKTLFLVLISAIFLSSCGDEKKKATSASIPAGFITVNTDYTTGSMSLINGTDFSVSTSLAGTISGDPVVRMFNGSIYVINRTAGNIMRILPESNNTVTAQESMGEKSNPHDICVVSSSKAYVTRYDDPDLWIIDPTTLKYINSISLADYSPSGASNPSMDSMYFDSARSLLYISLQRYSVKSGYTWTLDTYSSVIVINTQTDKIIKEIQLNWTDSGNVINARNPYTSFSYASASSWQPATTDGHNHILISCVGEWGVSDGGLIAIDLETSECEPGYIIDETSAGGDITAIDIKGSSVYAIMQDSSWVTGIMSYALDSKKKSSIGVSGSYPALAIGDDGKLFVCDNSSKNPCIRVFDTASLNAETIISMSKALPPISITKVQ